MLLTVFILILAMFGILTYVSCTLDMLNTRIFKLYKALEDVNEAFSKKNDADARTVQTEYPEKPNRPTGIRKTGRDVEIDSQGTDNNAPSSGGLETKEKKMEAKFKVGDIVRHKALGQKFVIVNVHAPNTQGSFRSLYDTPDPLHRYSVSPAMAPGIEQRIPEPALELITEEKS